MESDWLSDWFIFTWLVKDAENDVMLDCVCVCVRARQGRVCCGNEAGAAESPGVEEEGSADQTEETGS